ncbi:MAG: nucleotidyltransferase domain-containing protein [Cyanothece sp. SIO2G6]|nr:nucleotidyltransferase domain-containing protein [Cyanothece sp. SIO2G6]
MKNDASVLSQVELCQRLQAFKAKRGTEFHLTALGYFGSYARGEASPDSDVDVVFDTTKPNLLTTAILKQELEQWLDRPVDLIRLHPYLHPEFKARIERDIIYV